MKKRIALLFVGSLCFLFSCQNPSSTSDREALINNSQAFDSQGHRGCRGLLPENSIPAFIKAIDLGMTTLEMDVVVSKDSLLVVSHEPFLSTTICLDTAGNKIEEEVEKKNNLFQMNYDNIKKWDCGGLGNARFPHQQKMSVYKPLLTEVIDTVEKYLAAKQLPPVRYNIETKSDPTGKSDEIYHPTPTVFSQLLIDVIQEKGLTKRATIQSFDVRTLQAAKKIAPQLDLVLLIANEKTPAENVATLGFVPQVYSPYYKLVNDTLMDYAKIQNMQVIPWTVNTRLDMQRLIDLGVHGIITDYPDSLNLVLGR